MDNPSDNGVKTDLEQIIYANLLTLGVWLGLALLCLTYFIYIVGILSPHVDVAAVIENWDQDVGKYMETTKSPHGWDWIGLLDKADFLNFIGFVLLAMMTKLCYIILFFIYMKRRSLVFSVICILEIAVLTVAASGILGTGGH